MSIRRLAPTSRSLTLPRRGRRYTRNPAYLSMTMMYAGIAALRNALWAIVLLPVALLVIQRGVIEREERNLERKFGEEYLSYNARVRRWI